MAGLIDREEGCAYNCPIDNNGELVFETNSARLR